jgi:hypothetical protein
MGGDRWQAWRIGGQGIRLAGAMQGNEIRKYCRSRILFLHALVE